MDDKEAYEKAIEAYQFHVERYNTWMNYYSIFVGALFVALYSVMDKCSCFDLVKSVIALMGLFASVCWLFSFRGYYSWLISWTNVVQFYEKKVATDHHVYLLINKTVIGRYGYSTQKVTLCFIFMAIIAWGVILGWVISPLDNAISIISFIIGLLIVLFAIVSEINRMQENKVIKSMLAHLHSNISELGFKDIPNDNDIDIEAQHNDNN